MSSRNACHCGTAIRGIRKSQTFSGPISEDAWKLHHPDGALADNYCPHCGDELTSGFQANRMVRANHAANLKSQIAALENKIATMIVQCPLKERTKDTAKEE